MMTQSAQPILIDPQAYRQALITGIRQAKQRVSLAAMIILWGKETKPVFDELKKATKRGVKVRIVVDIYTRLAFLYGITQAAERKERLKKTFAALQELAKLGAKVHYFGTLGIPPQKGRCHVKITVIDNHAYSFGGMNIFDAMFHANDYMLHYHDKTWADCLDQLVERIGTQKPPLQNGEVEMSKTATILFDGGTPKKSVIYDKARELAAQATRIWYVSWMAPTGKLATLIGTRDAVCYTNRPLQMNAPDRWAQAFDLRRYRIKNEYHREPFLHAKLILFELRNGQKALLSGSHNFSYRGVVYGTQEIALYSTDPALWDRFYDFIQKNIADPA